MDIIKVRNKFEISEFHKITHTLYKKEKMWIPHVKQEVEAIFNIKKNNLNFLNTTTFLIPLLFSIIV